LKSTSVCVGILSDTHGYIHPGVLEQVNQCDAIVHAGDICGSHVLEQLKPLSGIVIAVRGNNDVRETWQEVGKYRLAELQEENHLDLPGGRLSVIHGHQYWGRDDPQAGILSHFPNSRAVVYGHSHFIQHDRINGRWLLNPGAAGKRLNRGAASCLILKTSRNDWHVKLHRFEDTERRR